jgi:hypothetical protein
MIYQLAKTSPLITGQVKMNMIMNGNKVVDLQYVPISNYIPFAYNNPIDVLNYTHGENVKKLYSKISDYFFKEVVNPTLSTKQLHRYDTLVDDTHENTYEMGMKRIEYKRYKKQFEFFCPVWCDNADEFKQLRFIINLENRNGRTIYSKEITFDDNIKKYINKIHEDLGIQGLNNNLLYVNFQEMLSHIKGLNVKNGKVQTIDTSYIVNNLLYQERPVLETDNMLVNLFNSHNTIATQIFNFNFVFDLTDFMPISLINDFLLERINVYVDVYKGYEKVKEKDLYSNYDNIPRYDIYTGEYNSSHNVLDYLMEYKSTELITKNKLSQGTFHWCLQNNDNAVFNLYNGFAPIYNSVANSSKISCDHPDLFTDVFDKNKNPLGVFKYTSLNKDLLFVDFVKEIEDNNNYFTYNLKNLNEKEYDFFGNILISNNKLSEELEKLRNKEHSTDEFLAYNTVFSESTSALDDYSSNFYKSLTGTNNVLSDTIDVVNAGIFNISQGYNYNKIRNLLSSEYLISSLEYEDNNIFFNDINNFIVVRYHENEKSEKVLTVAILLKIDPDNVSLGIQKNLSFKSIYNGNISKLLYEKKQRYGTSKSSYKDYPNGYINNYDEFIIKNPAEYLGSKKITQKAMCYNALDLVCKIINCAKFPNIIVFDKSLSSTKAVSPSVKSDEINLTKADKSVCIYRYDSNLYPMFIDTNEKSNFKNNVYWCKQYNKTIMNTINDINNGLSDIDGIVNYSKYALYKFTPLFKSIGYFVLNSKELDYKNCYLYDLDTSNSVKYVKEISWYKNNSMIYLPSGFTTVLEKNTGDEINHDDIVACISSVLKNDSDFEDSIEKEKFIKYYISNLYSYEYEYDYKNDSDITKQIYKIKFTLK